MEKDPETGISDRQRIELLEKLVADLMGRVAYLERCIAFPSVILGGPGECTVNIMDTLQVPVARSGIEILIDKIKTKNDGGDNAENNSVSPS